MAFLSCEEMLAAARSQKISLAEAVLRSDLEESRLTEAHSRAAMRHLWQVMQATSQEYDPTQRSRSGLSGGDAAKVEQAWQQGRLLGDDYLAAVTAEALKTAECNACMKRIVAAPTAGSCGVLPAVLLPLCLWFTLKCRVKMKDANMEVKRKMGVIYSALENGVSGVRTAKAFANEELEKQKFDAANDMYRGAKKEYYKTMGAFMSGMEFTTGIMPVVVIAVGGVLIMNGRFSYIDLITFTLYVSTFINPVRKLAQFAEIYMQGAAGGAAAAGPRRAGRRGCRLRCAVCGGGLRAGHRRPRHAGGRRGRLSGRGGHCVRHGCFCRRGADGRRPAAVSGRGFHRADEHAGPCVRPRGRPGGVPLPESQRCRCGQCPRCSGTVPERDPPADPL